MSDSPNHTVDLQRSYGSNWTKTNVNTLFEWITLGAFYIKCLDMSTRQHRSILRNWTIVGLCLSTLCGTIALAQFTIKDNQVASDVLNGIFALFTFSIAVFTGYLKVYQIQERLEAYIRLKQEWIVFSTAIASELQLPIELRRDAVYLIIKNKNQYLNLLKVDLEIADSIKKKAIKDLPNAESMRLDLSTLPRIIMDIGLQEMQDLNSAGIRNKDRFSHTHLVAKKAGGKIQYVSYASAGADTSSPDSEFAVPASSVDYMVPAAAMPAIHGELIGRTLEPDTRIPLTDNITTQQSINSITLEVHH